MTDVTAVTEGVGVRVIVKVCAVEDVDPGAVTRVEAVRVIVLMWATEDEARRAEAEVVALSAAVELESETLLEVAVEGR